MSIIARSVGRVPRIAVAALVLMFGGLPANAGDTNVWAALERPENAFLSGLQGCEYAFDDGASKGSQCLVEWSANHLLLDALTRFATEQGRAAFGEHFLIVNDFSYSPYGSGLSGGLDVVLPLVPSTDSGTAWSRSNALFFQQGVTRWVDDRGSDRNDIRLGAVRRFNLSGESTSEDSATDVLGISAFVQQSLEFQHTRLVAGADYAGKWGRGSLNLFVPTTGWVPALT